MLCTKIWFLTRALRGLSGVFGVCSACATLSWGGSGRRHQPLNSAVQSVLYLESGSDKKEELSGTNHREDRGRTPRMDSRGGTGGQRGHCLARLCITTDLDFWRHRPHLGMNSDFSSKIRDTRFSSQKLLCKLPGINAAFVSRLISSWVPPDAHPFRSTHCSTFVLGACIPHCPNLCVPHAAPGH